MKDADERYKRKITEFRERERRMPTYTEMLRLFGFRSRSSVWKLVHRLAVDHFLAIHKNGRIAEGPRWKKEEQSILMLGLVEAGFPSPAEQDVGEHLSLDEYLVPNRDAAFILKVKGDSMKDAGIVEGDMVIAERASSASPGTIVIAEVDGEWTMKYYRMRNGKPYLEAANSRYRPIIPKGDLRIAAKVVAVVRKYR